MKRCPLCSSRYPAEDDFCPNDGSALITDESPANIPTVLFTSTSQGPRLGPNVAANTFHVSPRLMPQHFLIGVLSLIVMVLAGVLLVSIQRNREKTSGTENQEEGLVWASKEDKSTGDISPTNLAPKPSTQSYFESNTAKAAAEKPRRSAGGSWNGDWSSPSGAYLTIGLNLNDDGNGNVNGQINWTLRRSNRPDKMNKIGLTATEYVSGHFDNATGTLSLRGYRKDDPNNVLVMVDTYRLRMSGDSRRLSGSARNGGNWNASVNLAR